MDPVTAKLMSAAGAAADPVYVDDVFSCDLWTGNSTTQTITNGIDLSGEGGLVWIKNRDDTYSHHLFDTENGPGFELSSNSNGGFDSDTQVSTQKDLYQFNSSGYSIGQAYNSYVNRNGEDHVGWTFRKCPGFFDIVTYTGNGVEDSNGLRTISHNLGAKIGFIAIKNLSTSSDWVCAHTDLQYPYYLELNTTQGSQGGSVSASPGYIYLPNNTTNFQIGNGGSASAGLDLNINNNNYVAYIWALGTDSDSQVFGDDEDEAIIKCGSFTASDGSPHTVTVGFEPQWVIIKRTTNIGNWSIIDNMRGWVADTSSDATKRLLADSSNADEGTANMSGLTSTGFTVDDGAITYGSNQNYIYIAIRRSHKPPSAGTEVLGINDLSTPQNVWTPGFATDTLFVRRYGSVDDTRVAARLMGNTKFLATTSASSESSDGTSYYHFDDPTGTIHQSYIQGGSNTINYAFKRAPGFFDVVTYTGTGSARTVNHNLGVAPELMIVKQRDGGSFWAVYSSALGATKYLSLASSNAENSSVAVWNNTSPTSSVFTVNYAGSVNNSGSQYIVFLFASLSGISKIGTYSGTGSAQNIDCGFTNGARFVLIKRTDSSDSWHLFDTTQGINSGNDPYFRLNLTAAQSTGNDFIDPLSSGFTLASSDGGTNASGGTYFFLAIA